MKDLAPTLSKYPQALRHAQHWINKLWWDFGREQCSKVTIRPTDQEMAIHFSNMHLPNVMLLVDRTVTFDPADLDTLTLGKYALILAIRDDISSLIHSFINNVDEGKEWDWEIKSE